MDIERARAISVVAQTVIDSARVEVKFLEATGQDGTKDFFAAPAQRPQLGNGNPQR
jgi:hypothetical protein